MKDNLIRFDYVYDNGLETDVPVIKIGDRIIHNYNNLGFRFTTSVNELNNEGSSKLNLPIDLAIAEKLGGSKELIKIVMISRIYESIEDQVNEWSSLLNNSHLLDILLYKLEESKYFTGASHSIDAEVLLSAGSKVIKLPKNVTFIDEYNINENIFRTYVSGKDCFITTHDNKILKYTLPIKNKIVKENTELTESFSASIGILFLRAIANLILFDKFKTKVTTQ